MGQGVGRNVFLLFEWITDNESFATLTTFCGENALHNGERLIDSSGNEYLFDRQTPYVPIAGTEAGWRLLTIKDGGVAT